MKTTWRRINSVIHPNRVKSKLKLKLNDELLTDTTEIASTFNNHFSNVAQVLNANNITLSFKSKGAAISKVPSCIYRKLADIIAPVLSSSINEVVVYGSYSNLFKVARVTTIHKSGSKLDSKIYRPKSA